MRRGRLRRLLKYLLDQPVKKFTYSDYFKRIVAYERFRAPKGSKHSVYNCGTAACVAGHACILFDLHGDDAFGSKGVFNVAAEHLGLSYQEANFLFTMQCATANRAAAVARLRWLLNRGTPKGYNLTNEAETCGYRNPPSAYKEPLSVEYAGLGVI